jgi:hypothetical protein
MGLVLGHLYCYYLGKQLPGKCIYPWFLLVAGYFSTKDWSVGTVWKENNSARLLAFITDDRLRGKNFSSIIRFHLVRAVCRK